MTYHRFGGAIFDTLIIAAVLTVVGLIIWCGAAENRDHPRVPCTASVAPGQTVYHGWQRGTVIAVTQGSAESAPAVRVRFCHDGIYSEATFQPEELTECQ